MRAPGVSKKPVLTGEAAVYPWSPQLAREFTVADRFDQELRMWRREGDKILLPRESCPLSDDDRRIDGPRINVDSAFSPRNPEQRRVAPEIAEFLLRGESGVFQAKTGFGKTACACDAISRVGRKTLVIVPGSVLMEQWVGAVNKFLPGASVGTIRQDTYDVHGKDVVIGMLKSLAIPERYPEGMAAEFGLVVWDEVHRVPADTFQNTVFMFPAKRRLGLSAEPSRPDGREVAIWAHIGPVRVQTDMPVLTPKVAVYASPWRCPPGIPHSAGKCGHIITNMARHRARNSMLAGIVLSAYERGRRIVVFSDRVSQLRHLMSEATSGGVPAQDQVLYISAMGKKDKENAPAKRVLWATYGMMGEGTDIPWLDTCVFATPRSNIIQPMGRVRREYEGKPQPVVVDIVDTGSPVFSAYHRNRLRQYSREGAEVREYASPPPPQG